MAPHRTYNLPLPQSYPCPWIGAPRKSFPGASFAAVPGCGSAAAAELRAPLAPSGGSLGSGVLSRIVVKINLIHVKVPTTSGKCSTNVIVNFQGTNLVMCDLSTPLKPSKVLTTF